MEKTDVIGIAKYKDKEVSLQGWVYNKRSSGKVKFLVLRDGTGKLQCILVKGECPDGALETFSKLTQESSIRISGIVNEHRGKYELHVRTLELLHKSEDYPITPKEHGIDYLMDRRHLWLRSSKQHAILRVRSELINACHTFFHENGFVHLDAPIFTPSACEGTSNLFEVEYFDDKAYLTQSGQLYNEAGCMAFGKVYCYGPTFRAEKSKTRRHLTEFWMIEPEMAFCDLEQDIELAEAFVEYIVQRTIKNCKTELKHVERDVSKLSMVKAPFDRISYDEAAEILKKEGLDFKWGSDFGGTDETVLTKKFDKPLFVDRFPSAIKAFYMKKDPNNPKLSLSMDLLAPEGYGEIIGGGQREDDVNVLLEQIDKHQLSKKDFEWYLDLRRHGSVPHAGFGLGIERTLSWICGLSHVRETIPFPRLISRLRP